MRNTVRLTNGKETLECADYGYWVTDKTGARYARCEHPGEHPRPDGVPAGAVAWHDEEEQEVLWELSY